MSDTTTATENSPRGFSQIKSRLARSLEDTLRRDCNPPPDDLSIPYHQITEDKKNPGHAFALVTYIVFCPTKKVHTVNIHFKYDKFGKFILDSMRYV